MVLPLLVQVTLPSSQAEDANAEFATEPHVGDGGRPLTPETQAEAVGQLLPMLLAKPYVHGVIWNQLSDQGAHELAHAGLLDQDGLPKPALSEFSRVRRQHLM